MTKVLAVISLTAFLFSSCSNSSLSNSQNTKNNSSNSNRETNSTPTPVAAGEPTPTSTPMIRVRSSDGMIALQPSDISDVMEKYRKEHPDLTVKEIAEYGNAILPEKGFNYWIDVAALNEIKEKKKQTSILSDDFYFYPYEMTLSNGSKRKFLILAPRYDSCCCGYYYADFPVLNITENNITFVADGKTYTVKRTEYIGHNEVYALVDRDKITKEIHKWQVPAEGYPLGISADGTKLYVGGPAEDIYLEISPDGNLKFVPKDEVKSGKGEFCPTTRSNPDDAYESCMRFTVGDKTYFVRFSGPCT